MTEKDKKEIKHMIDNKLKQFWYDNLSSKSTLIMDTATDAQQVVTLGQSNGVTPLSKIGFYGKTRIVQQANTAGNVVAPGSYNGTAQKMLNDAYSVLRNLGLLS